MSSLPGSSCGISNMFALVTHWENNLKKTKKILGQTIKLGKNYSRCLNSFSGAFTVIGV